MEKTFRLPKEFAIKWLEALRSGKYTQLEGQLIAYTSFIENSEHTFIYDTTRACCLGVAAVVLGASGEDIGTGCMPATIRNYEFKINTYPKELLGTNDISLPSTLALLNDGFTFIDVKSILKDYPNLIFKKMPKNMPPGLEEEEYQQEENYRVKYSFTEIAEWIEDNVEFYEDERVQEVHETTQ